MTAVGYGSHSLHEYFVVHGSSLDSRSVCSAECGSYKVVTIMTAWESDPDNPLERNLNALGREDWEVVNVRHQGASWECVLKRLRD